MGAFIPKCHWLPFFVWRISGSRSPALFLVARGASMMLASTIVPRFRRWPGEAGCALISPNSASPRPCLSSRGRKCRIVVSSGKGPVSRKPAHRPHLAEQVLHPRIAQVAEQPDAVNPQHRAQGIRPPATARLRVKRRDPPRQTVPRNQPVHLRKKQLPARPALLRSVRQRRKRRLLHEPSKPDHPDSHIITGSGQLIRGSIARPRSHPICVTGKKNQIPRRAQCAHWLR